MRGTLLVLVASCGSSSPATVDALPPSPDAAVSHVFHQITYLKPSDTTAHLQFGLALSITPDGNALAVGASQEFSTGAGAAYLFARNGTWQQTAKLLASNPDAGDAFGVSIALSADGNTLVVGATHEASNATGIGGDQTDNSAIEAGAVYVFALSGTTWTQQAYVKASNTDAHDHFGTSLALSADGNTLAVSAPEESSAARNIDGDQTDNSASGAGAVYVFTRANSTWTQQAYVKAPNTTAGDRFGVGLALSADGNTLAAGAPVQSLERGAVFTYVRSGTTWTPASRALPAVIDPGDGFGLVVALSADGNTLAAGSIAEDGGGTGATGDPKDNSAADSGAAYVFTHATSGWTQQAYLKASNTETGALFGAQLALSPDGETLAIEARSEDSGSSGIDADQTSHTNADAGAVYVWKLGATGWAQVSYLKASNAQVATEFGSGLSVANGGNPLAAGGWDDSGATGIDGNEFDGSAPSACAAYIYE